MDFYVQRAAVKVTLVKYHVEILQKGVVAFIQDQVCAGTVSKVVRFSNPKLALQTEEHVFESTLCLTILQSLNEIPRSCDLVGFQSKNNSIELMIFFVTVTSSIELNIQPVVLDVICGILQHYKIDIPNPATEFQGVLYEHAPGKPQQKCVSLKRPFLFGHSGVHDLEPLV